MLYTQQFSSEDDRAIKKNFSLQIAYTLIFINKKRIPIHHTLNFSITHMGLKEHHFRLFHPPIYLIGKFFSSKFIFLTNASPAGFCCSFRLLKRLVSPTSTRNPDTILISLPMISNTAIGIYFPNSSIRVITSGRRMFLDS